MRPASEKEKVDVVLAGMLEVPPICDHGNVIEISEKFGGADKLREAVVRLQALLYAA